MAALVDEVCLLLTRVALCNPAGMKHFTLTRVEESPRGAAGCDERVPQVQGGAGRLGTLADGLGCCLLAGGHPLCGSAVPR